MLKTDQKLYAEKQKKRRTSEKVSRYGRKSVDSCEINGCAVEQRSSSRNIEYFCRTSLSKDSSISGTVLSSKIDKDSEQPMKKRKHSHDVCFNSYLEESAITNFLQNENMKDSCYNNGNQRIHTPIENILKEISNENSENTVDKVKHNSSECPRSKRELDDNSVKSENSSSKKDYQWHSRGNRNVNYSKKLFVPKKEFYLLNSSNTRVSEQKVNTSKLKLSRSENKSGNPKNSNFMTHEGKSNKQERIENFFRKKKYISSEKMHSNSQIVASSNLELEKLSNKSSGNNHGSSKSTHSSSLFDINVAFRLSSQISNIRAKRWKSEESIISESNPLTRYIKKKPLSDERSLSNSWISLNLFQNTSVNDKLNNKHMSTIKTQTKENRNPKETSTFTEENNSSSNIESHKKSPKSNWISRGRQTARTSCFELSVTTADPFIKRNNFNTNSHRSTKIYSRKSVPSSNTPRRNLKSRSPIIYEKRRQTTLHDFFPRKCENVLKQKNHLNKTRKLSEIANVINKEEYSVIDTKREIGSEKENDLKRQLKIYDVEKIENILYAEVDKVELKDIQQKADTPNYIESNIYVGDRLHERKKIDYLVMSNTSSETMNDEDLKINQSKQQLNERVLQDKIPNLVLKFPNKQDEIDNPNFLKNRNLDTNGEEMIQISQMQKADKTNYQLEIYSTGEPVGNIHAEENDNENFSFNFEESKHFTGIQTKTDTYNSIQNYIGEPLHEHYFIKPNTSSLQINEKNFEIEGNNLIKQKTNEAALNRKIRNSDVERQPGDIDDLDFIKFKFMKNNNDKKEHKMSNKTKIDLRRCSLKIHSDHKIEANLHNAVITEKKSALNFEKVKEFTASKTLNQIESNLSDGLLEEFDKINYPVATRSRNSEDLTSVNEVIETGVFLNMNIPNHSSVDKDYPKFEDEINSELTSKFFTFEDTEVLNSSNIGTEYEKRNIGVDVNTNKISDEITTSSNKTVNSFLSQKPDILHGQLTKISYNALEDVSSPILMNPECQTYLKALVCENKNIECSQITKNNLKHSNTHSVPDEVPPANQINSEENNFLHFWENMLSQNQAEYSQTLNNSTNNYAFIPPNMSQNNLSEMDKFSQGSEIFQYILSQDCAESDSLINNALKNMNNLSQKILEKRNLIFSSNLNANKLLWMALNIYAKHKERSVLAKTQSSEIATPPKLRVVKNHDGILRTYTISRSSDSENSNSNNCGTEGEDQLWNHDIFTKSATESDKKILLGLKDICLNSSFLYVESDDGPHGMVNSRCDTVNKIKSIFENILNDFDSDKPPYLEIRRQTFEDCMFINDRLELKIEENPKMMKVKYQNTQSQFKFCLIMFILAKVLEALETSSKTTRRELYYQIKHLISNQSHIDRAVKAISCMLCVGPWNLNIVAHKGIVFGDLKITMSSNEIIDCSLPGTSIPQDVDEVLELKSSAFFIIVVEKESIFYKILEEKLPSKLIRPFLMITGKGFPDLNTQLFLKKLWMVMSIPIFIFTDADPHGVNIMMTYRFGSLANAHLSQQLAIPKAQWLGVFPSEVIRLNADKQILTEMEKNVIKNLLKTPYMRVNKKIEEELKFMLDSGYKAGIEGIIKNNSFLSEFYFPLKFHNKDLI